MNEVPEMTHDGEVDLHREDNGDIIVVFGAGTSVKDINSLRSATSAITAGGNTLTVIPTMQYSERSTQAKSLPCGVV